MGFMSFKEWRKFSENIMAGIFGGLVVVGWQMAYDLLRDKTLLVRGGLSALFTLIFLVFLILILRFIFLKKGGKR